MNLNEMKKFHNLNSENKMKKKSFINVKLELEILDV